MGTFGICLGIVTGAYGGVGRLSFFNVFGKKVEHLSQQKLVLNVPLSFFSCCFSCFLIVYVFHRFVGPRKASFGACLGASCRRFTWASFWLPCAQFTLELIR